MWCAPLLSCCCVVVVLLLFCSCWHFNATFKIELKFCRIFSPINPAVFNKKPKTKATCGVPPTALLLRIRVAIGVFSQADSQSVFLFPPASWNRLQLAQSTLTLTSLFCLAHVALVLWEKQKKKMFAIIKQQHKSCILFDVLLNWLTAFNWQKYACVCALIACDLLLLVSHLFYRFNLASFIH